MGCCNIEDHNIKRSKLEIHSKLFLIHSVNFCFKIIMFFLGIINKNYKKIFIAFSQHNYEIISDLKKNYFNSS